jgi:hypothetical protein
MNALHPRFTHKHISTLFWPTILPMSNQDYDTYTKNNAALFAALVSAVAETKDVHADSTNPFHKNKYASLGAHLAVVKPIFAKHGLAILQFPSSDGNHVGVTTTIVHKDGGMISESIHIPVGESLKGQDAGSIISYLRRYSLASVAGIATEDDDAETDRIVRTSSSAPVKTTSVATAKFIPNPNASAGTGGDVNFDLPVPFGKNKGSTLNELPLSDLDYWANKWEPKPWEKTGKVGPKDLALKASAQALWAVKNANAEPEVTQDEVPF